MNKQDISVNKRYVVSLNGLVYQPTNLIAALVERGHRATAPRKAIVAFLEQANEGLTAEAINEKLPSVGRATVYRTIKLLLEVGVVCKIPMMDGSHLYGLARSVCLLCGAMVEFKAGTLGRSPRAADAGTPGQPVDHHIELTMTCDYCRADGDK